MEHFKNKKPPNWIDPVWIDNTPVFNVGVTIDQQDIHKKSPSHPLQVSKSVLTKSVYRPTDLFVIGRTVFVVWVQRKYLGKVLAMYPFTLQVAEASDSVGIFLI